MIKVDFETLEKLTKLMASSGIKELEIEHDEDKIKLRLADVSAPQYVQQAPVYPGVQPPQYYPAMGGGGYYGETLDPARRQAPQPFETHNSDRAAATPEKIMDGKPIKSPFVGTYYAASSPDAEPFVKIGQRVQKGDTLCIIEAMKIMNEIEAEESGTIQEILVKNEDAVEFDQLLFVIK